MKKKIWVPLATVSLTAILIAGCGTNNAADRNDNGMIRDSRVNNVDGRFRPLDTPDVGIGTVNDTTGTTNDTNENDTSGITNDTTGTGNDTTGTPNDTTGTPNDTTGTPGTDNNNKNDNKENGSGNNNAGGKKKFKDVKGEEWYSSYIQWGADQDVINGFPDGSFQPNKPLTRAEVIKIINTMAEKGFFNTPKSASYNTNAKTPENTTGAVTKPKINTKSTTTGGSATKR